MMTSDNERTSITLYLKRNEKCLSPVQRISSRRYYSMLNLPSLQLGLLAQVQKAKYNMHKCTNTFIAYLFSATNLSY